MNKIKSSKNPLIKEIKSLYRKRERKKLGLFLVEGIKIVEELVDENYLFKKIVYTDSVFSNKDGKALIQKIGNSKKLVKVSEDLFKEISDTENPQGILGLVNIPLYKIEDLNLDNINLLLYLDEIQDPGNMGTIIRSADAFNIDGIIIPEGCVDPYNPKVARATMGSIFRVPLYFIDDGVAEIKRLKSEGIKLYSSSLVGSVDIGKINFKRSIVAIGNESKGVSPEIHKLSDKLIKIPMLGESESLNAGVAASIIMYQSTIESN